MRNYARNYAEAAERLSGDTERLSDVGEVAVHAVTEARVDDWLQFFDHDGFAGNPDWASCYCLEPHVPTTPEQPERPWRDTRQTMIERLRDGTTLRLSRLRRRSHRGMGERVVAFELRSVSARRCERAGAAIRRRRVVLRRRAAVSTARGRRGIARPRDCRCRGVAARRVSRAIRTTNPKPTTRRISAARVRCTKRADSNPSRCRNATRSCAAPFRPTPNDDPDRHRCRRHQHRCRGHGRRRRARRRQIGDDAGCDEGRRRRARDSARRVANDAPRRWTR